ncbi:hypothetical protein E4U10_007609, partial [Claviceps purpurea]
GRNAIVNTALANLERQWYRKTDCFWFKLTPPALATPTTAITARSRPYSAHKRPLHASQTPIPIATLQQCRTIYNRSSKLMGKYMLCLIARSRSQSSRYQPQQRHRQLPVFPPPQPLQQVAVAEFAKPSPAPASSVKQLRATFNV